MEDKVHPLVELLLARMGSNPEEFLRGVEPRTYSQDVRPYYPPRWEVAIETIRSYGSEADKARLEGTLNSLLMDEAHNWALDELLNGEERRRKDETEAEAHRKAMQMQAYQQYGAATLNNALSVTSSQQATTSSLLGSLRKGLKI